MALEEDPILADLRADEARIDALIAKIAQHDRRPIKELQRLDEDKLEAIWGGSNKDNSKGLEECASIVLSQGSKVVVPLKC